MKENTPGTGTESSAPFEELGAIEVQHYVVAELNEERERRVRIDTQGSSLISGSTALSALAFAAASLVTGTTSFALPRLSLWTLALTFIAFMATAFCGLRGGGKIHENDTVPIETLLEWADSDEMWFGARSEASRVHLFRLIDYLQRIRSFNDSRARWVIRGSRGQVLALLGLVTSIGIILVAAMNPHAAGWHQWLLPPG
jgi:hypothetical protein